MSFWICATCAVEHAERTAVCAICADDRQWVPADGQRWTTLEEMADAGCRTEFSELEPDLWGIRSTPDAGIGQVSKLLHTDAGSLLFDPIGFIDDAGVDGIRSLGPVVAIIASHPHMYGVQVEWSRALGGVPVLVAEQDRRWVARPDVEDAVHARIVEEPDRVEQQAAGVGADELRLLSDAGARPAADRPQVGLELGDFGPVAGIRHLIQRGPALPVGGNPLAVVGADGAHIGSLGMLDGTRRTDPE